MSKELIIGNTYDTIYGENMDGTFESEEMELVSIKEFQGEKIYVFRDSMGYEFATYDHNNKIDWDFMAEIANEFGY